MRWPFQRSAAFAIRRLEPDWASSCAKIHAAFFARPWESPEIEALLRDPAVLADGAFDGPGRALLGFAISRVVRPEAELLTIAVAGRSQGHGLGGALLDAHLARLAAAGVADVFLEVDEHNAPAQALYRRRGFAEVGRRPGYYPRKDGSRATALVLRGKLS